MEEVFTALLEDFLQSPLVCWVSARFIRSFMCVCVCCLRVHVCVCLQVKTVSRLQSDGSHLSEFMTLVDGVYLNDIMLQM